MKFDDIDTVLKEAEDNWIKNKENGYPYDENDTFKKAYIFGWLQYSYQSMYNCLPDYMKKDTNEKIN